MIQNRSKSRKSIIKTYRNTPEIRLIKLAREKRKHIQLGFIIFVFVLLILKIASIYYTFNLSSITNEFESFEKITSLIIIAISIKNDLIVFASILLLRVITNYIKYSIIKLFLNVINYFIILFYVYDCILIYFSNRLYFFDIKKFIVETPDLNILIIQFSIFVLVLLSIWQFGKIKKKIIVTRYISLIITFFLIGIIPVHLSSNYAKQNLFSDNIFQTNLELDYVKKVKNSYELSIDYENNFIYEKGKENKENVILLIVESLSSVDSIYFSDLKNYMPGLDQIAQDGNNLMNLRANGNTTDGGMVSILQGTQPIPYGLDTTIYNNYFNPTETLPNFFNNIGYNSIFLTTGPLEFLRKGEYLKNIGYKEIIGRDMFSNEKTYTFWSPPDEVLYNYGIELIKDQKQPFFLNMLTISSHLSYDTPYGKTKEEMYKYVDENLLKFYNKLKDINYFDNGILIIVGDHRKMTPLEDGELDKYGISAYNRIPCIMIGKGISQYDDYNLYQQTDLFYSIKNYFGTNEVVINNYNNIFEKSIKRNFTISPYLSNKNKLIVEENDGNTIQHYTAQLKGEQTSIIDYKGNNEKEITEYIIQQRAYQQETKKRN